MRGEAERGARLGSVVPPPAAAAAVAAVCRSSCHVVAGAQQPLCKVAHACTRDRQGRWGCRKVREQGERHWVGCSACPGLHKAQGDLLEAPGARDRGQFGSLALLDGAGSSRSWASSPSIRSQSVRRFPRSSGSCGPGKGASAASHRGSLAPLKLQPCGTAFGNRRPCLHRQKLSAAAAAHRCACLSRRMRPSAAAPPWQEKGSTAEMHARLQSDRAPRRGPDSAAACRRRCRRLNRCRCRRPARSHG